MAGGRPRRHFAIFSALGVWAASTAPAVFAKTGVAVDDVASTAQVPILFNDHHVAARPSVLTQGRVLVALGRGTVILVPLRSLFEQLGASVSYDPTTKTVHLAKVGADIRLTVGKTTAIIDGEARPLDVPPQLYRGTVVVPIRVISETLGAYVDWDQRRRVVVVRYLPPTPSPTPVATVPPTPMPTLSPPTPLPSATPAPTPTPVPEATVGYEGFLLGDYVISPKVSNEFSPGNSGSGSFSFHGAYEFPAFKLPWMVGIDGRQYTYATTAGPVTTIGRTGSTTVPSFSATDREVDGRFAFRVANPRLYVGIGYAHRTNNYGYPTQSGLGFGVEKLPDLERPLSVYVEVPLGYYPEPARNLDNAGQSVGYGFLKYAIGLGYNVGKSPIFVDLGYEGDRGAQRDAAPSGFTENGPYLGIGLKI